MKNKPILIALFALLITRGAFGQQLTADSFILAMNRELTQDSAHYGWSSKQATDWRAAAMLIEKFVDSLQTKLTGKSGWVKHVLGDVFRYDSSEGTWWPVAEGLPPRHYEITSMTFEVGQEPTPYLTWPHLSLIFQDDSGNNFRISNGSELSFGEEFSPSVRVRKENEKALVDYSLALKDVGHQLWVDPIKYKDVFATALIGLDPISATLLPRFKPMRLTAVYFDSTERPVILICKARGTTYTFKIGMGEFIEFFSTTEPRKYERWGKKIWNDIDNGEVETGMTQDQARLAWGPPDDINRTSMRGQVTEQWVYGSRSYLYFTNGVLDATQN